MFTRKNYIDGLCTHSQYYDQFVHPGVKACVSKYIGLSQLYASVEPDNLNDIPLEQWDRAVQALRTSSASWTCTAVFKEAQDFPTHSGWLCILKEAARQMWYEWYNHHNPAVA